MGSYGKVDSPPLITTILNKPAPLHHLPKPSHVSHRINSVLLLLIVILYLSLSAPSHSPNLTSIQKCAIRNLQANISFLNNTPPIPASEFISRRDNLASVLSQLNISSFILEPGYTFQYYANTSQIDWEPWEPEERPFLMLISPIRHPNNTITARTTFLAPAFEANRVRSLGIPSSSELEIVTWEEHWNPYLTLLQSALFNKVSEARVMIDDEMRDFIVRGLTSAGFDTLGLHPDIEAVRQQKSNSEITLLRAVNTGTVNAIRAMRPCLRPGVSEGDVTEILNNALLSVPEFSLFFNIVLFDENAASPHGGYDGSKKLEYETMVLIDVGAHYRGYSSDVCRSFMIDPPLSSSTTSTTNLWRRLRDWPMSIFPARPWSTADDNSWITNKDQYDKKLRIWTPVFAAQTASIAHFIPNATAASVDTAARTVISAAGYGKQFTHRVGHGIGIKAHESPYLHQGNTGVRLLEGMVFTSEPGVYIEGEFGVRREDVFMVRAGEEGAAAVVEWEKGRGGVGSVMRGGWLLAECGLDVCDESVLMSF